MSEADNRSTTTPTHHRDAVSQTVALLMKERVHERAVLERTRREQRAFHEQVNRCY